MSKKENNKIYIKATNYFNNGEIQKALSICEEGIAKDLNNSAILNLKGLLLYIKGDLNGATTTWKINSDFNDDQIAKNYLEDSKKDRNRLIAYKEGERLLKKISIEQAIEKFKICQESDFNSINVNSALAVCYLKKGEYTVASLYTSKVLEIDRSNPIAINVAKELETYAGIKLEVMKNGHIAKKIAVVAVLVILIAAAGASYLKIKNNSFANSDAQNQQEENAVETQEQDEAIENTVNEEQKNGETKKDILVDSELVDSSLKKEDYEALYNIIRPIADTNTLDEKQKASYSKAKEALETKGTEYFYKNGVALFKEEKFETAEKQFIKAYDFGAKSYLYQHEIFYLGAVNEKLNDKKEAIDYYQTYYTNYKDGSYIQSVMYALALLHKDDDLSKSKQYAKELVRKFPKSIYNNEIISDLLK